MQNKNLQFAKTLRTNQTDAELKVWQALRGKRLMNFKFKRQVPIGDFIVDFICFEQKLIIEIDGGQHLENSKDLFRSAELDKMSFQILRYWNNEVIQNFDGVLAKILQHLEAPSPQPSPKRERE